MCLHIVGKHKHEAAAACARAPIHTAIKLLPCSAHNSAQQVPGAARNQHTMVMPSLQETLDLAYKSCKGPVPASLQETRYTLCISCKSESLLG
jgi:hypothetical protein